MRRRSDLSGLLRWYPRAWRERYGDEFAAFLDDSLAYGRPTFAFRASIAWAGLRERVHAADLAGDATRPAEGVRAGSLLVLGAWAVYVAAGASFAKLSEQFDATVPAASRAVPWGAFKTVQIVAVVAATLVGVGAVVAIPAYRRFLHAGGWLAIRRHVRRAMAVTLVAIAAWAGLLGWASSLSFAQRNGGDWAYELAFVVVAVLTAATLGLWTVAAVAVGRRLALTPSVLAIEALLAAALTAGMVAMTTATAIWWSSMAADAPWFLHGAAPGSGGSPFEPRLAVTMAVMVSAVITAS
jgi:hypothetical protein